MSALTVRDANYFRSFKFTDNAKLVVPESGLYCVYAQIFLNAKLTANRNQEVIFAENSLLPFAAQHLRNFHLSGGGGGGAGKGVLLGTRSGSPNEAHHLWFRPDVGWTTIQCFWLIQNLTF